MRDKFEYLNEYLKRRDKSLDFLRDAMKKGEISEDMVIIFYTVGVMREMVGLRRYNRDFYRFVLRMIEDWENLENLSHKEYVDQFFKEDIFYIR